MMWNKVMMIDKVRNNSNMIKLQTDHQWTLQGTQKTESENQFCLPHKLHVNVHVNFST
jgi:hypothetical protein